MNPAGQNRPLMTTLQQTPRRGDREMAKSDRWTAHAELHGIELSFEFEIACMTMAKGPEWKAFLDGRLGSGKWVVAEILSEAAQAEGKTVALRTSSGQDNQLGALAVEHGYERLKAEIARIEAARAGTAS